MRPIRQRPSVPHSSAHLEIAPATLADLRAAGIPLFCWCNRCCHNGILPLEPLLARLGPQEPIPRVGRSLVCSACGSKDIATRPHWKGLGEVANHTPVEERPEQGADSLTPSGTKDDHTAGNGVLPGLDE